MGKIGIDSNVFLSVLLQESTVTDRENVKGSELLLRALGSNNTGITSSIVLSEIAWAFLREGKGGTELEATRQIIEKMEGLKIVKVDNEIAWDAGKIRRRYYSKKLQISYQDAIYLATCINENTKTFYTTDKHLLEIKAEISVKEVKTFRR